MKRVLCFIITITLILCVCACGADNDKNVEKRSITDMSGNTIELPETVDNYCVAWAGLTDILLMMDGTAHLSAYPEKSASFKWIFDVYPDYASKECLSNEGISAETIIETGAQVVFLKASDDKDLYNRLRECGIAAIDCQFDTYEDLQVVVKMIAEVLGTEEANKKAEEYCKYINAAVEESERIGESINSDDKVSVLVIKDTKDYSAYGSSRYTGKWVEMCGGIYSMVNEDTYANVNLTKEQIYEYNPDYIFFAMPNEAEKFITDDTWSDLNAIKNGHVYNIPGGFNTWSNCGAESALVFKWAVATMYSDASTFDVEKEIRSFYSNFYGYEVSEEEITKILVSSF